MKKLIAKAPLHYMVNPVFHIATGKIWQLARVIVIKKSIRIWKFLLTFSDISQSLYENLSLNF
jgi:hypothetical protein